MKTKTQLYPRQLAYGLPRQPQAGFTLIDVLIGLLIGLLVVTAALSSVVFTRTAQVTLSDSTRLQQQASIVMRMIGFQLRQAGAFELNNVGAKGGVSFNPSYNGYNGTGLNVSGLDGAGANSDTLRISAQDRDNAIRDCLGNASSNVGVRLDTQFTRDTAGRTLDCLGANTGRAAQAIAIGVDDFQVRYAVATTGAGNVQQIQYRTASQIVNFDSQAAPIRAVSVCLVLSGEQTNAANGGNVVTGCNGAQIAADGRIRRTFTNTYFLRNQRNPNI